MIPAALTACPAPSAGRHENRSARGGLFRVERHHGCAGPATSRAIGLSAPILSPRSRAMRGIGLEGREPCRAAVNIGFIRRKMRREQEPHHRRRLARRQEGPHAACRRPHRSRAGHYRAVPAKKLESKMAAFPESPMAVIPCHSLCAGRQQKRRAKSAHFRGERHGGCADLAERRGGVAYRRHGRVV